MRKETRYSCNIPCIAALEEGESFDAILLNISLTGAAIKTAERLPVHDEISISIDLSHNSDQIIFDAEGLIIRQTAVEEEGYLVGICFSNESMRAIAKIVPLFEDLISFLNLPENRNRSLSPEEAMLEMIKERNCSSSTP